MANTLKQLEKLEKQEKEALAKLKEKKKAILEKREKEIARLVKKVDVTGVDNKILLGALAFAKEIAAGAHKDMKKEFEDKAKPFLSRGKQKTAD